MTDREKVLRWHDPLDIASQARNFSGIEVLRQIRDGKIPPPPYAALMNVRLTQVEEGRAVFEAMPAEEHYNPMGAVHGGFAMSLLDFALGSAIFTTLPAGVTYGTVDVHARLLRPITKDTGMVRCEGKIVSATRTLATSEARITDSAGKLLATGTTACVLKIGN